MAAVCGWGFKRAELAKRLGFGAGRCTGASASTAGTCCALAGVGGLVLGWREGLAGAAGALAGLLPWVLRAAVTGSWRATLAAVTGALALTAATGFLGGGAGVLLGVAAIAGFLAAPVLALAEEALAVGDAVSVARLMAGALGAGTFLAGLLALAGVAFAAPRGLVLD